MVREAWTEVSTLTVALCLTIPPGPAAVKSYVVVCLGVTLWLPLAPTLPIPLMVFSTASDEDHVSWLDSLHLMLVGLTENSPLVGATATVVVDMPALKRGSGDVSFARPFAEWSFVAPFFFTFTTTFSLAFTVTGPDQMSLPNHVTVTW